MKTHLIGLSLSLSLLGCGGDSMEDPDTTPTPEAVPGVTLRVPVEGRVRIDLETPAVVAGEGPWDLAAEGFQLFTNSGPSGAGQGSAFGPFAAEEFATVVQVPLTFPDRSGGAFLDWYAYEGAPAHVLWSRYHVHLVRDGARAWKVQILGYYGEIDGAPVAGVYRLRYAELTASGAGPTVDVEGIDATAGGAAVPPSAPSTCLDLATGNRLALTPEQALASQDWHLCFRRQNIAVNGGQSGPRGVEAANLQATEVRQEALAAVKARTPASELARWDAVTQAQATQAPFVADGVVSAFGGAWVDRSVSPPVPTPTSWVVLGADGARRYRVRVEGFEGASASGPGVLLLRVRKDEIE
ncbi:MAG: hypothetical protein MUF64_20525 [Polyangiaceae bacterium]|jgi:hypothetical protein|nr:hypothetical protein [Polyangiaceae bacterium]